MGGFTPYLKGRTVSKQTAQHTPGPWESRPHDYPEIVRAPGGGSVAHCGEEHDVYHGSDPEVAVANARLIAAAPDLLAACEAVSRSPKSQAYRDAYIVSEETMRTVLAAIAKARTTN